MYWDKFDEWIKRTAYAIEPERLLPVETNPEHPQGKHRHILLHANERWMYDRLSHQTHSALSERESGTIIPSR
jgi:hypothetical protein